MHRGWIKSSAVQWDPGAPESRLILHDHDPMIEQKLGLVFNF